jgi:flagellar protein FlaG
MKIASQINMESSTKSLAVEKTVVVKNAPVPKSSEIELETSTYKSENTEEYKSKVKEVVSKMNEMLEVNDNSSKFLYHEGLDRYYVTIVNKQTNEVVKEIPPKKLLDAFYEMQKMLGMIVDKKI